MTGARGLRPSCPSGSERGPARSPETPSPLTMRTRDRLRLLRALRRRRKRKRRRTKRRKKCGNLVSQEELPNHLKNCSLYSRLSPVDCALQNKYFVFILSLKFLLELKHISIAYIRDVCHHINCCEFHHFNASVNWNQTQASIRAEPNKR